MAVMGSDEFVVARSTVAGNTLDLGEWYGYQEVLLKNSKYATEFEFKFYIPDDSYLDILLDKQGRNYSGIRLSRSPFYPSIFFSSDAEGRFYSTQPIPLEDLEDRWHKVTLGLDKRVVSMKIDQRNPIEINSAVIESPALGLRAGYGGAKIDDVAVKYATGKKLTDSFRNERKWLTFAVVHFVFLAMAFGAALFLALKVLRWPEATVLNGSILVTAQIFLCLSLYHAFDFYFWSKLPFQTDMRLLATGEAVPQMSAEKIRVRFFRAWQNALFSNDDKVKEVMAEYPNGRVFRGPIFCGADGGECSPISARFAGQPRGGCSRFLLIGTSQSVGAGAENLEETFFARLHRGLSRSLGNRCVESLNLSISASNLSELTEAYLENASFRPDIVLVNLSNNDTSETFYDGLRRLAEINKKFGSRLVFVEEANSIDAGYAFGLRDKHEIMRKVARELGIETFALHEFLGNKARMQSGQVWWDKVHLSSYGHSLVADWLLPKVLALWKKGSAIEPAHP